MTFPAAALEQHTAILGKTGAGKSYTVRGLVENLLLGQARVCIVDYTGVWWGLRLNRHGDGPSPFNAVIFGGDHADIPLSEGSGPIIARVVAEGSQPVIIDVDGISVGAQQRFITAFLEELYKLNRRTLHLVIEEADEFAPQTGAPGAERMIGATCRIFQRGRVKGFRAIAVTQRPANIHKRVLTQCNTLVAMRLTAPQDHKAVADWIKGHGDSEKGDEVIKSLARLHRGQGWVWAPELDRLELEDFPSIQTYDSMRAPMEDEALPAPRAIDLAALKAQFAEAVKETEANDPKTLKAEIARLNAIISKGGTEQDARDAYDRGVNEGYLKGRREIAALVGEGALRARADVGRAISALQLADGVLNAITLGPDTQARYSDGEPVPSSGPPGPLPSEKAWAEQFLNKPIEPCDHGGYVGVDCPKCGMNAAATRRQAGIPEFPRREAATRESRQLQDRLSTKVGASLTGAAVKLLEAFQRYPTRGLTWEEACIVAGLVPGNGYFYGGKKALTDGQYVFRTDGGPNGDRLVPTDPSGSRSAPITRAEILHTWSKVKAPGAQMLEVVLKRDGATNQYMEQAIGLKAGNGYWYGGLKALKDANLVVVEGGWIKLTDFVKEAR